MNERPGYGYCSAAEGEIQGNRPVESITYYSGVSSKDFYSSAIGIMVVCSLFE